MSFRSYWMSTSRRVTSVRGNTAPCPPAPAPPPVDPGGAEPVDAGHRGDDDHVPPGHDGPRGAVSHLVDLLVDRRVFLDEGVRLGDVRLGLVIVVIGDEVLDGGSRDKILEFREQLGG